MSKISLMEKMKTPKQLYLICLDEGELRQSVIIPRVSYKISMETRNKAAQFTIAEFTKPTTELKNKAGPRYESDSSTSGGPGASNSKSPSQASLKVFIKALPYLEPLHFGFHLSDDDTS